MDFNWWEYFTSEHYLSWFGLNCIVLVGIVLLKNNELYLFMLKKNTNFIVVAICTVVIVLALSRLYPNVLPLSIENCHSLAKVSGICKFHEGGAKHDGGIYLIENNILYFTDLWDMCLSFDSTKLDGKNVTLWHKNNLIYQIAVDGNVLYPLELANTYITPYNLQLLTTKYVSIFLCILILLLREDKK